MNYTEKFTTILNETTQLIANCSEYSFNQEVRQQFFSQCDIVKDNLQSIAEEERLLRIGIVGTVKAGKSTFLNALLFEGQEVLPRAATPMTASLTCLRYAQGTPSAILTFYSTKDWKRICDVAEEGKKCLDIETETEIKLKEKERLEFQQNGAMVKAIDEKDKAKIRQNLFKKLNLETRSCMELKETCEEQNIVVEEYLDEQQTISFNSQQDIRRELEKYVGRNGSLTPLVRSVTLNIEHEMLRDIEIVDTPGLNDPVVSRSNETKKHLGKCDVVFLLSLTSHFLGAEDVNFINKALPKEGISHAIITASQLDNAILDLRKLTFREAYKKSAFNAKAQFEKLKDRFSREAQFTVVSAMLAACSYKKRQKLQLDDEETHIISELKNFADFNDSPEMLYTYSGLEDFTQKIIPNTRKKRDAIKEARQTEYLKSQYVSLEGMLYQMLKSTESFIHNLHTKDIEKLKNQEVSIKEGFQSVRAEISSIFLNETTRISKNVTLLENSLLKNIENFADIESHVVTEEERNSWTTGVLFWKKKHSETILHHIDTVDTSDALKQMRRYAVDAQGRIDGFYKNIINIEGLTQRIKQILIGLFAHQENFTEDIVLIPIETMLGKISISPFRFNNDTYNEKIEKKYPEGKVQGTDIYDFRKDFEKIMQDMGKNITKNLISEVKNIGEHLTRLSNSLLRDIEESILNDMESIAKMLKSKEKSIAICEDTRISLQKAIKQVRSIGE